MGRSYLEDLEVGSRFGGEQYRVDEAEMLDFAAKWDPRPIHLDAAAGAAAGFGGIIASGAYVDAIFTLLTLRSRQKAGDHAVIAAMGATKRFANPVRAGDTLTLTAEITGKRESKSRPDAGVLHTLGRLTNQKGEVTLETETVTLVQRTPRHPGE